MSLKHGLLGLLSYSDMTGYELGKAFQDSLSLFWQAQPSQIYRELNKMEEMGHLTSRIEIQTDKPNKRIYSITENGKAEMQSWLDSAMPEELMPTRSEILMRLFFSSFRSREETIWSLKKIAAAYQCQDAELSKINGIIDGYKDAVNSQEDLLYWDLTAEFGRAYCKMCRDWLETCILRLENISEELL